MRIVSLLASATEIVAALGMGDALVGRSHGCDNPPELGYLPILTAPRVNPGAPAAIIDRDVRSLMEAGLSVYDLDVDLLQTLEADIVVTQSQCDLCAVSLAQLQTALQAWSSPNAKPRLVSLAPLCLADIWRDIANVAEVLGVQQQGQRLLADIQAGLAAVETATQARPPKKVLFLDWTEPFMSGGHWIPEIIKCAGGRALLGQAGGDAKTLTQAEMETACAQADIILVAPCGFDLARSEEAAQVVPTNTKAALYVADGNLFFNRPSPALLTTAQICAEIFHPDLGVAQHQKHWKQLR